MAKAPPLPKRFQPLLAQANTETAIRYGSQEDALGSILASLAHDYGQQAQAQHSAGQSVLGALQGADTGLQKVYADAGLTPGLLAQIGGSPTGQRLAGELAGGRAGIQNQILGQQQGQQYLQGHIADMYGQDRGKVTDQLTSLEKEKGLYGSQLLDSLITGDRSARHDANAALAQQQHADTQAQLNRTSSQDNALIGQGLLPDASGNLQPLPGGKADPNVKKQKAKPHATPEQLQAASGQFGAALAALRTLDPDKDPRLRHENGQTLLSGHKGQPVMVRETVPNPNGYGDPISRTRPKLTGDIIDPKTGKPKAPGTGTPIVTADIPKTDQVLATAALDMYYQGYLSTATVKKLHALGYQVKGLPDVKTQGQKPKYSQAPPPGRPTAGS